MKLRATIKRVVPKSLLLARQRWILSKVRRRFGALSISETFSEIYHRALWGGGNPSSGAGSEDRFTRAYCEAVKRFASQHNVTRLVDLGCGDFRVGRQIITPGREYIGVDIVRELTEENERRFGTAGVQFRCLDITADKLPEGDLCLIRQVLQHLSNSEIVAALRKCTQYRWVIVTEHIPIGPGVRPNLDKPHGPDTRVHDASGVFLEHPPFSLPVSTMLDTPYGEREVLRTSLWQPMRELSSCGDSRGAVL